MPKQTLFIPGPVTVAPEVLAAMAKPMINHRGPEFKALLERISRGMQPLFGTAGEVVLLGSSGTGGLEAAVANAFSPGQKVLSAPVGVFGKRLANIAKTFGLEVEILDTPLGSALDPAALAARLKADTQREIAGILLTHNETSTGVQNDMAALAAAIGAHPATVIVDSVSGLGASDFKMDEWGFDIVVTASQKALAVPPGVAMVAISPRGWERIAQAGVPRFYFDLRKARDFAKTGETPWTPPVSVVFALDVAIERFHAEGAAHVRARHERNAEAIRAAAEALGLTVFSRPGAHSVTVVAIDVPAGIEQPAVGRELREEFGIVIGGGQQELKGKIFRIGTMGDITQADVIGALAAFELVLRKHGYAAPEGVAAAAAQRVFAGVSAPEPALAR
jgi:aspartate aminotransferase-like enzyme